MNIRSRFPLHDQAPNPEGQGESAGGTAPAADAEQPQGTPAASSNESLLKPPSGAQGSATQPAAGATDDTAWLPEKFRVMDAEGKLDVGASAKKLSESYTNLEKLKGAPSAAPATPADYTYQPPEQFKEVALDDALSNAFRERAHKAGLSQAQYEFVMGEYFTLVPEVLNAAAQLTAQEARAALQQVWKSPAEYEAGVMAAQRAVNSAPEGLRDRVFEKFGRDPDFLQFAAVYGREIREDRPPANAPGGAGATEVSALMASEAYRNSKHVDHQKVNAQVNEYFKRTQGAAPVL